MGSGIKSVILAVIFVIFVGLLCGVLFLLPVNWLGNWSEGALCGEANLESDLTKFSGSIGHILRDFFCICDYLIEHLFWCPLAMVFAVFFIFQYHLWGLVSAEEAHPCARWLCPMQPGPDHWGPVQWLKSRGIQGSDFLRKFGLHIVIFQLYYAGYVAEYIKEHAFVCSLACIAADYGVMDHLVDPVKTPIVRFYKALGVPCFNFLEDESSSRRSTGTVSEQIVVQEEPPRVMSSTSGDMSHAGSLTSGQATTRRLKLTNVYMNITNQFNVVLIYFVAQVGMMTFYGYYLNADPHSHTVSQVSGVEWMFGVMLALLAETEAGAAFDKDFWASLHKVNLPLCGGLDQDSWRYFLAVRGAGLTAVLVAASGIAVVAAMVMGTLPHVPAAASNFTYIVATCAPVWAAVTAAGSFMLASCCCFGEGCCATKVLWNRTLCCIPLPRKWEWVFREGFDWFLNSICRSILLFTVPIMLCVEKPLDFVKDVVCVFFVIKIDDYENDEVKTFAQQKNEFLETFPFFRNDADWTEKHADELAELSKEIDECLREQVKQDKNVSYKNLRKKLRLSETWSQIDLVDLESPSSPSQRPSVGRLHSRNSTAGLQEPLLETSELESNR